MNGLKHGLCAVEVVLPGEDPAEYDAELGGWRGDWKPITHTRAVLVELAAVATWRVRRSIRSESAHYARRAEQAGSDFDAERLARVERIVDRFEDDPVDSMALLESDAPGIDRLIRSWGEIVEALERGPAGWRERRWHTRLMLLLGHPKGTDLETAGPLATASARLMMSGTAGAQPLPEGEAEETVSALRRTAAEALGRLRELRGRAPDRSAERQRAIDAASAGDLSAEARLRHRYEMEHRNALKWALRQLMALEKSGLDLIDEPEPESGPEAAPGPVAAAPDDPEKQDIKSECKTSSGELASVGGVAPSDGRPGGPSGTPGRPGGPVGADPGPKTAPQRA